uniref:PH domain-containing protein n=1 Tax=Rhabditophanes sp. KR3021 TaxID=114890 RepID=A0AC35TRV9_9BILA
MTSAKRTLNWDYNKEILETQVFSHVIHEDFKPFLDSVQGKVQKAKDNFKQTQEETEELKKKMLNSFIRNAVFPSSSANSSNSNNGGFITELALSKQTNSNIKQGYVYMQEKSKIPKGIGRDVLSRTWTKYYCVYSKETRIFTMIPVNRALDQSISFKLKTCTRRASDSIDKRFCFDLVAEERPEVMTFQALSEEDRRQWLDAMDGREPVYSPGTGPHSAGAFESKF